MTSSIRRTRRHHPTAFLALLALGAVTACADDATGDSVVADSVPGAERDCEPVNPELEGEATATIDIELSDYAFDQTTYEVPNGVITFHVTNLGDVNHEVAFLPGGGEVPMVDGRPDEDALAAAGAFELEAFGPDRSCNATYELAAGTYTLFCIVRIDDGHTHLDEGMTATLVVT